MNQGPTRVLALLLTAGCVRVDPGPNGVASARLDATAPSIVAGDRLRDSLGAVTALRALLFDEAGRPATAGALRFTYVPTRRDSLQRPVPDTALVVDSLTGEVRATLPIISPRGVVAARVGGSFQLVDTLEIVPRPDSAVAGAATLPDVRFDCRDLGVLVDPAPAAGDTLPHNLTAAVGVTVFGDSVGQDRTVRGAPVRGRLVRWTVVSPANLPAVRVQGGTEADTVPALAAADSATGRRLRFDTTDATGRSVVRLRLAPAGLGRAVAADTTINVVLRASVQPGPVAVRGGTFDVRVRLRRRPAPAGMTPTCQ